MDNTICLPCDGSVLSRSSDDSLLIDERELNVSLRHDVIEINVNTSKERVTDSHGVPQFLEPYSSNIEVETIKGQISNLNTFNGENLVDPSTSNQVEETTNGINVFNGHNHVHYNHNFPSGDANLISSTQPIQKPSKVHPKF